MVYFSDLGRARGFADCFDGMRVNRYRIEAYIPHDREGEKPREKDHSNSREQEYERERHRGDVPGPKRSSRTLRSKTVSVKGYPREYLGDRNLWNDFRETGFIRHIEVRGDVGYIQFDSENDALACVESMDGRTLTGSRISVKHIPDRILNLPDIVVELMVPEKEQRDNKKDGSEVGGIRPEEV
jgi:hypothetical protein